MATRGQRRHLVTLQNPSGPPVSDGDGGFTHEYVDLDPPTRYAEIKPATVRDLERVAAGTVLATATQIMTMDYHAGITTQTRVLFNARQFSVVGVSNPEERNIDSVLQCVEVVQ